MAKLDTEVDVGQVRVMYVPKYENIKLEYKVKVLLPDDQVLYADRAEVFKDEHGVQWIKFIAKNGYAAGHEVMVRTENIIIIRMNPEQNDGSN
jgi:hypothetical protein